MNKRHRKPLEKILERPERSDNMMEYKGYMGHVEFDDENGVFYGNVVNMRDTVTFQGESVDQIRHAFKDSVDDYLDFCAQHG